MEGETFLAETDAMVERVGWSLDRHAARLSEKELSFHRSHDVVEIDLDGERLVYSRPTQEQTALPGFATASDADLEASLVQWLKRECRAPDIPQAEMMPWIAALITDLLTAREEEDQVAAMSRRPQARVQLVASRKTLGSGRNRGDFGLDLSNEGDGTSGLSNAMKSPISIRSARAAGRMLRRRTLRTWRRSEPAARRIPGQPVHPDRCRARPGARHARLRDRGALYRGSGTSREAPLGRPRWSMHIRRQPRSVARFQPIRRRPIEEPPEAYRVQRFGIDFMAVCWIMGRDFPDAAPQARP